jgi:ATP/maltotriose-dependent transcriptional regulator MalT
MQIQLTVEGIDNTPLSPRELEVLYLVAVERSNAQIARQLVISQNTVKVHLRNIFEKLDVETRLGAVMFALQQGWLKFAR